MSIVVDRVKWPAAGLWPALLFGALPGLLVLWDWAAGADLVGRLWTMPMPVLALIAVATTGLMATGASPGKAVSDCSAAGIWAGRSAAALFVYAILVTALAAANPVFGLLKLTELALCAMLAFLQRTCPKP